MSSEKITRPMFPAECCQDGYNPFMSLPQDFVQALRKNFKGEIRDDLVSRTLYSTDASIYQIEPLGVAFPRDIDDLTVAVDACRRFNVPLLARGAGSSLAGQAVGQALIVDCSRHLTRINPPNIDEMTVTVEPGVILANLNKSLAPLGLQFGPDPASAERATVGGSFGNNATGAHSLLYGMFGDHVLEADVVMADGTVMSLGEEMVGEGAPFRSIPASRLYKEFRQTALKIRSTNGDQIRSRWPRTWRNASGYALNTLLPWSPAVPTGWDDVFDGRLPYPPVQPESINLAKLIAGSEGTLAVVRRMKLRLVHRPQHTILAVLAYNSMFEACDAVPEILSHHPSAVELIPKQLVERARSVPMYASQITFLSSIFSQGLTDLLVVEFAGSELEPLLQRAHNLGRDALIAQTEAAQKQVWAVRKIGMGLVMAKAGAKRPAAFIEDLTVPVENLGAFAREMGSLLADCESEADIYGHASAGCLHIRPIVNLKTASGIAGMHEIARGAVEITLGLGGTVSGEHGDGIARSAWLERMYGSEIVDLFREIKDVADPWGILNPGKIVDPLPMDQNLRFGEDYSPRAWKPVMGDSTLAKRPDPILLIDAIEQCNGAGVCRKSDGVMCPSFQATQDEMHSTRGRANLLRAMISGRFPDAKEGEEAVKDALDLCLACKGCKAECPSSVDMARLKYEFLQHYHSTHPRKARDYLFGYISTAARLGSIVWPLANAVLDSRLFGQVGERFLGLAPDRLFPQFSHLRLSQRVRKLSGQKKPTGERVLFLRDSFSEYFYPEAAEAALNALTAAGCDVTILPVMGAGRTLISKGFLEAARKQAARLVDIAARIDPRGEFAVVGVEPSEIYTLADEYPDLLADNPFAQAIGKRAWMIDEYLIRPDLTGEIRLHRLLNPDSLPGDGKSVVLHGHCHQKSLAPAVDGYPNGTSATLVMLRAAGYTVRLIEATCCGMAGAFGYESEHYDVSMSVGELSLFPAVRSAGKDEIVATPGVSCQAQIVDATGRKAVHPIRLISPDSSV